MNQRIAIGRVHVLDGLAYHRDRNARLFDRVLDNARPTFAFARDDALIGQFPQRAVHSGARAAEFCRQLHFGWQQRALRPDTVLDAVQNFVPDALEADMFLLGHWMRTIFPDIFPICSV